MNKDEENKPILYCRECGERLECTPKGEMYDSVTGEKIKPVKFICVCPNKKWFDLLDKHDKRVMGQYGIVEII